MENKNISNEHLEDHTYRELQQIAKARGLPSNYKKIYLIELIQAKMYKTDLDVHNIIHRAKQERLRQSKIKKQNKQKRLQAREACNKTTISPEITATPKRPSEVYMKYSQKLKKPVDSLHPKRSLLQNIDVNVSTTSSDRVLRSYSLKTVKPNYALMNDAACSIKAKCDTNPTEVKIKFVTDGGSIAHFNMTTKSFERRKMNNRITNDSKSVLKRNIIFKNKREILPKPTPLKRQRTISGIYPLEPEDIIPTSFNIAECVRIRKVDGSFTKVNAVFQKNNKNILNHKTQFNNTDINLQDIINESVDANLPDNLNMKANDNFYELLCPAILHTDILPDNTIDNVLNENEQKRDPSIWQDTENLPKIHYVFSRFDNLYKRDHTQPQYMQISTELGLNCVLKDVNSNNLGLESIYNFKLNTPLCTIANTKCVESTKTIVCPTTYQSTVLNSSDALNVPFSLPSPTILPTYQEIDAGVNIPEMVEDALEIISQDGDYMERMGMDMQVQCVLCSWAGSKIILECHVQKEHVDLIHKMCKSEWNMTFTLESLVQCSGWLNQVVEYDSVLYVLSAKYEDPGCLMAVLMSLSAEPEPIERTVAITMYNKITGEPFSWSGQILALQPNLPHETVPDCLKVDFSKLDLLPNSANLKLVNREFVTESPSKVVVGQPVLNDIHIIIFVKIVDEFSLPTKSYINKA